jgi:hypothetical protein
MSILSSGNRRRKEKNTPLEYMVKNLERYLMETTELMPNKLKVLCEVYWPAFGVGWTPEVSLDKTMVNKVYRVIKKKNPNTQENGKSQKVKIGLQKPDSVVYLNSDNNLLGILKVK